MCLFYFSSFIICRHTGSIECANSLSLVYTPKRMPLRYVFYCSDTHYHNCDTITEDPLLLHFSIIYMCFDFSYKAYKSKKQLTAIDWNYHINLPTAKGKTSGQDLVSRKYNPRTRQWDVKVLKVDKGYEYIPVMIAKILKRRMEDIECVTRNVSLNESDPAIIAPIIAHIAPPPMSEIVKRRSRFSKK